MNWGRRGAFLCRSPPTPERSDYEDYQGKAPCMTPEGYDLCNQGAVKVRNYSPRDGKNTSPGPGGERGVLGSESRWRPDSEGCRWAT
jgi:hypothetical protein